MKEGVHPTYREVVFQDMSSGFKFITRSTLNTRETIKMEDGKEYPLMKLDVTSESHPFYTGAQQRISETGRVEKFRQKFARGTKAASALSAAARARAWPDCAWPDTGAGGRGIVVCGTERQAGIPAQGRPAPRA